MTENARYVGVRYLPEYAKANQETIEFTMRLVNNQPVEEGIKKLRMWVNEGGITELVGSELVNDILRTTWKNPNYVGVDG